MAFDPINLSAAHLHAAEMRQREQFESELEWLAVADALSKWRAREGRQIAIDLFKAIARGDVTEISPGLAKEVAAWLSS